MFTAIVNRLMGAEHMPTDLGEDTLHVLLRREDDVYVAQCIEYDIAAEADTIEAAKKAFVHTIIRHVLASRRFERPLFWSVPAPPPHVRETWEQVVLAGGKPERLDIPAFTIQRRSDGGDAIAEAPRSAELLCA